MVMKNKNVLQNEIIAHRYKIIKQLGKGGMGIVYLVEDILKGNKLEALKIIRKEIVDENALEIFQREFDVMTRLKHPNLAQVYDFGFDQQDDNYFITMEYIDGISLKKQLKLNGKFTQEQTIDIIVALCRTLEFIHTRKVFHNDIKPANIMLQSIRQPDPMIKVLDFGLSDLGKPENRKTKGTLQYIAPETLFGAITRQADIYAAGVTFYELLTGNVFYSMVETSAIISILKDKGEFIRNIQVALDKVENPEIRMIIAGMLEYNPRDRYQYCSEIIHDINKNIKKDYVLETAETREAYVLGAGFVGRQEELSKLKERLGIPEPEKAVVVRGRAGIGKSRLYQEFRKHCQLRNIPFLEANCSEKVSKTYVPFLDILCEVLLRASTDQINKYGPELKKLLPDHTSLMGIEIAPLQQDVKIERGILVHNITGFLLDYARKYQHIAIYLNDIHWADEGTLKALKELMYKLSLEENRDNNLRVYTCVREEEIGSIESFLNDLREKARLEEISLHPFETDHVAKYLDAVFGDGYIAGSLEKAIPEIEERVGGNPFFLQELIKSLIERGFITRHSLKWELIQSIGESDIPGNLKEILQKRLDRLGLVSDDKKTLQFLALLNKKISINEWIRIFNAITDTNIEKLFALMEKKELFSSERMEGGVGYKFSHSIIREVVEQNIEDVKPFHNIIADRLETVYKDNIGDYIDELAYHYSRAENREKSRRYLEKAGDSAKVSFANEKAIGYFDQLLDLLKNDSKEDRINILIKQSEIYDLIGMWDDEQKVLNNVLELSKEIKNTGLTGKIKNMSGDILRKTGDHESALQLFEESMQIFKESGDQKGIQDTVGKMGKVYLTQKDYFQAMPCFEKQLKLSEKLGDKMGIIRAVCNMGNIYFFRRDYSQATACFEKQLKISEELGDKMGLGVAMGNIGHIFFCKGNYSQAMKCFEKHLELSEKLGDKMGVGIAVGSMGHIHFYKGDYPRAMKCFIKQLKISEELGRKIGIGIAVGNMGNIHSYKGDYSQAMECFEKQLDICEKLGDKMGIGAAVGHMGNIDFYKGDYSRAMECFVKQLNICEELGDKIGIGAAQGNMGNIYFYKEDYSQAMVCFEKQLKLSKNLGDKLGIGAAESNMGKIYFNKGDYSRAMACFNKQLKICEELGDKMGIGVALGEKGTVYKRTGDYLQAEKCFDKYIAIAEKLQTKKDICISLYKKADLYFTLQKFSEAESLNKKTQLIAEKIEIPKLISCSNVLKSKIKFALSDKAAAINILDNLLTTTQDDNQIAEVNYELWKMNKQIIENEDKTAKHKSRALRLYRELYNKAPNIIYKERVEELEKVAESKGFGKHQKVIEESKRTKEYFPELMEMLMLLNSNLVLSELLIKIVDLSIRFIDAERGFLLLYDSSGQLQMEVARNRKEEDIGPIIENDPRISQTVVNTVVKSSKPLFVPNITEMDNLVESESIVDMSLKSAMCIPLGRSLRSTRNNDKENRSRHFQLRTELLGILYVDSCDLAEECRFHGENLQFLQALADQASIAIVNALVYEKSNIDSLTRLYLRPYFDDNFRSELLFHENHGLPLCLMMMDIDLFKKINDTYGHQAGDDVLQIMGEIFKRTFRSSDICARYGGDEFIIALLNTGKEQVKHLAEKLIRAINAYPFPFGNVSVSIGISVYPDHGKELQKLLKRADEALYAIKTHGRDGFQIWQESYSSNRQSCITDVLTGDPIRDYRNVEILLKSIMESSSILDLTQLTNRIADNLLEITGSERCILMLVNQNGDLEIKVAHNKKGEELLGDLHYSRSICEEVFKNRIPVCLNDIGDEIATESQMSIGLRSAMSVPFHVRGKQLGVIYLDSCQTMKQFSASELSIFTAIASQFAFVIENSNLHEEAIKAEKIKERLLEEEIIDLHRKLSGEEKIIGKSKGMKKVFSLLNKLSKTDVTVLISGETGTGKESIARAIHNLNFRKENPFVVVDCGSIPAELIESELFGHEKGAFTGAYCQRKGLFEVSNTGTIFLDEIGELPMLLQTKLLRVIQEKDFRRVGGSKRINIDVRIIAASSKNLKNQVKSGMFREDLYYRLNVFPLKIPPLRERDADIMLLANYFLGQFGRNRDLKGFTKDAEHIMERYNWPGNVRELQHIIERAVIMSGSEYLSVKDLEIGDKGIVSDTGHFDRVLNGETEIDLKKMIDDYEMYILKRVYLKCGCNQRKTARMLKLNLGGLQYKLKTKYKII